VIVVDASAMVFALVSADPAGDRARSAMTADDEWIAPAHMPLEVLRTLSKAAIRGRLKADDAQAAFQELTTMQISYATTDAPMLHAVWAMRHNASAYDAAYLAIALEYEVPLITFDSRLANAAKQIQPNAAVVLLSASN
jgi:predicted nucleic acid-binding protein